MENKDIIKLCLFYAKKKEYTRKKEILKHYFGE